MPTRPHPRGLTFYRKTGSANYLFDTGRHVFPVTDCVPAAIRAHRFVAAVQDPGCSGCRGLVDTYLVSGPPVNLPIPLGAVAIADRELAINTIEHLVERSYTRGKSAKRPCVGSTRTGP